MIRIAVAEIDKPETCKVLRLIGDRDGSRGPIPRRTTRPVERPKDKAETRSPPCAATSRLRRGQRHPCTQCGSDLRVCWQEHRNRGYFGSIRARRPRCGRCVGSPLGIGDLVEAVGTKALKSAETRFLRQTPLLRVSPSFIVRQHTLPRTNAVASSKSGRS
jgi:hypothetical protein